jgi:hypothetical protein
MSDKALMIRDELPLMELGNILAKSGFFQDTREAGQAIVKVLAGRELGFGAIASMTGIYIVKGRVSLSANLMAAAVKRTARYNYRVVEHTDKVCDLAFWEDGKEVGRSRFTVEDARRAGTQNMEKYPKNMLFARAMSNGVKWFCPDVFGGPVYTPEEMGAKVDEEGEVIDVTPAPVAQNAPEHPLLETKVPTSTRPFPAEVVKAKLDAGAKKHAGKAATPNQRGLLVGVLAECYAGDDEARHVALDYLTGEASTKAVPDAYVLALLDWLAPEKDSGGAYQPNPQAEREAALVLRQARLEAGQVELPLPA